MKNMGTMVKSALGVQEVNGVITHKNIEVPVVGPKAQQVTIDKATALSSFRITLEQAHPGELFDIYRHKLVTLHF